MRQSPRRQRRAVELSGRKFKEVAPWHLNPCTVHQHHAPAPAPAPAPCTSTMHLHGTCTAPHPAPCTLHVHHSLFSIQPLNHSPPLLLDDLPLDLQRRREL